MGFQAGQHEIVAETLSNQLQQDVIRKSKEIIKKTKNNIKEAKKISETLNRSYKELDKCKSKYHKSYHEMEDAKGTFMKADCEGTMSRNEISKLKHARKLLSCQITCSNANKICSKNSASDFICFNLQFSAELFKQHRMCKAMIIFCF